MADAKVVNLASSTDKTVILNVRAGVIQPFQAPDWLDLRVGFLLSLTKAANDDDITGLAEELTGTYLSDRVWIGVKTRDSAMPGTAGTAFIGFGGPGAHDPVGGMTKLVSSDIGIGTTNANFWRLTNTGVGDLYGGAMILDGIGSPRATTDGTQQHFAQNAGGAGGYATLLMLRLQRDNNTTRSKIITVTVKTGTHNGDVLYTNTPTKALLQSNLEAFPSTVQQLGPLTLSSVPDALYLYWPFHDSRLRIHAAGILKVR